MLQKPLALVHNLKVLIVEDDKTSKLLILTILKKFTREMITVESGIEAVIACRMNSDIDLIFMDIRIPGIDGFDAAKQIRLFNTHVTIVAQTALPLNELREKSINAGCNELISKPFSAGIINTLLIKHFKQA